MSWNMEWGEFFGRSLFQASFTTLSTLKPVSTNWKPWPGCCLHSHYVHSPCKKPQKVCLPHADYEQTRLYSYDKSDGRKITRVILRTVRHDEHMKPTKITQRSRRRNTCNHRQKITRPTDRSRSRSSILS